MCRREMLEKPGKGCGCGTYEDKETIGKEELLAKLKRHERKLKSELIAIDGKLKSADKAGKGGE